MAIYTKLTPIVLKWEGGYAGNIDGMTCTMKGVTLAAYIENSLEKIRIARI